MARREYKGAATPTTLTTGITNSATSLTITDATNWPTGSFSFVIDPGIAGEEKVLATSRSGTTITITTRGYDNTTAAAHNAGATVYPVPTAIDFDEANAHTTASSGVHGITGSVVGTTDTQTLSAKTLTSPIVNLSIASPTFTTNAYTLVAGDAYDFLTASNGSTAATMYIPTNASVAFAVGTQITVQQTGAGQITFVATTPATTTIVSTGATSASPKLRAQYSSATLLKTATDAWTIVGDIA